LLLPVKQAPVGERTQAKAQNQSQIVSSAAPVTPPLTALLTPQPHRQIHRFKPILLKPALKSAVLHNRSTFHSDYFSHQWTY
jgi:hypothetical protein